jgi:hypothetical protein
VTALSRLPVTMTPHHSKPSRLLRVRCVSIPLVADHRYRHASPSGPWPWMDFSTIEAAATEGTVITTEGTVITTEDTATPNGAYEYPENLFPNWKSEQVKRSQMLIKCEKHLSSILYWIHVHDNGSFTTATISKDEFLDTTSQPKVSFIHLHGSLGVRLNLQPKPPETIRVRLLFVDDLTPHVLQILGTRYGVSFLRLLALKACCTDTRSNHSSSRPPLIGYPRDTRRHSMMGKEIVGQKLLCGAHANLCDRHHYYLAIRTNFTIRPCGIAVIQVTSDSR